VAADAEARMSARADEAPREGGARTMVVVVTGLSGAGKSTAMGALEDLGFYCVENLPPNVIEAAVAACEARGVPEIALSLGVGIEGFVEEAARELMALADSSGKDRPAARSVRVLFLDASDEAVLRRFNETRRPHPLLMNRLRHEVIDAIRLERERLAPLRAFATSVVDTSGMRVHDLRRRITAMMRSEGSIAARMQVRILSFGFKFGVPSDADLLFDVRFLDNPYFVDELRPLTGEDARVREHVMRDPDAHALLDKLTDLLRFLLPRYEAEGKSYLTVAIGCTGGQHRSVSIAILLCDALAGASFAVRVVHRDALPAGGPAGRAAERGPHAG
jgi:UPF0042 nucleotide-binding protein